MMKDKYYDREEYTRDLIDTITSRINSHRYSKYIKSVVVTGSFGRNEPMYELREDNSLYLRSDIEIGLVYSDQFNLKKIYELIKDVEAETDEALELLLFQERRMQKVQNFNYTFFSPKYKTLFTYDIFNSAYTSSGTDYITCKNVNLSEVDLYEAKKIVANRIAEYICFMNRGLDVSLEDYQTQWKAKIMLAIVTAWLLCKQQYVASYRGQYKTVLNNQDELEKVFGHTFADDYEKSYLYLRASGNVYDVDEERLRIYVRRINGVFKDLGLRKSRCNCSSKKLRMLKRYIKHRFGYGVLFEDRIYQKVMDDYCLCSSTLGQTAKDWFEILY